MSKELVVSATPHETRVAILEDGQLCEIYIEREKEYALVGSIYKGRVTRVLPGMQSAFVDIGLDSDAFLYVSDFLENLEEYDHIVSTVEGKVQKMEQQGGQVFAPPAGEQAAVPAVPSMASTPSRSAPPEVTEPSEAEVAHPVVSAESPAPSPEQSASAPPPASRPLERRDRAQGGYGRDRGSRGRWGRRGRGGERRPGRDLPPAKYASSRPYEPRSREPGAYSPHESQAAPPAGEVIILPGESLAKYKGRVPAPPAPAADSQVPPSGFSTPQEHGISLAEPKAEPHREGFGAPLPESLYVGGVSELPAKPEDDLASGQEPSRIGSKPPVPRREDSFVGGAVPARPDTETLQPREPSRAPELAAQDSEENLSPTHSEADLSDDEVAALAEQLAEAKHEEAQDEVEELHLGEEEEAAADVLAEPYELQEANEETEQSDAPGETLAEAESEPPHVEAGEQGIGVEPIEPSAEQEPKPTAARVEDRSRARFQRPMRRGGHHRGRQVRHHDHRAQPRRPQLISEMLKAGQEIIVQIAKEPLGKKGARLTSHVALPGRSLVYMPTVDHVGVSRKIASAENRARLRRLVAESKGSYPGGFIVRTAAENATDEEIRSDVEFLGRTWDEIRARSEQRKAPALLHRDLNLVERILRDYLSNDYTAIWVDNEEEYSKVVDFVSRFQPKLVSRVKLYTKEAPIFEEFGIQQELDKALRPKVWLKSGGYIVINHTEALVAIDVNTGKYVGRGSTRLEDTIVKTNVEAVKEIVRQIRLRDLGGIIVVDFIDMEERRNREKVMGALEAALLSDRAPSKVLSFNEFGLVAITRKRTKQALERVLCQPCPYCTGSGMVKSIPTICYEIQAEARKMASDLDTQSLTLRVNPEIAKALKTRESSLVEELEQATRKSIIIQSDPTLHWEQYDIY